MAIIHFQPEFRPALPCVFGAKEYCKFRTTLIEMDRILAERGGELALVRSKIEAYDMPFAPGQFPPQRQESVLTQKKQHNRLAH